MSNIFDSLGHLIITLVTAATVTVTSVFSLQPVLTPTPTPIPITMVTAKGSYSYNGYKVNLVLQFPKDGGQVTGSVDGDCIGKVIGGQFTGGSKGFMNANIKGTCTIAFFTVDASASVQGDIYLYSYKEKSVNSIKDASVNFIGEAQGIKQTGTINLTLSY